MCGGVTLCVMGGLRLAKAGFTSMPRLVAVIALVSGAVVTVFGVALPFIRTEEDPAPPAPRIALAPDVGSRSSALRDEVHVDVRTPDDEPAAGVRVRLIPQFDDEGAKVSAADTDEDGRVAFTGLDVTPGTPHIAEVRYDGATFASEVLRFGRGRDDPVRIVIAQTTRSSRDITLELESIAIVGDEKGVQAIHAVTVHNGGERAFVGGLRLPLLPGANAIDPRGGLDRRRLDLEDGTIVSSSPVAPGRHNITYTYIAPLPRSGLQLTHRPTYPTDRFEVLVGGEIEATGVRELSEAGDVRVGPAGQERDYKRYEASRIGRDDRVVLVVGAARPSSVLRIGGLILAALLALGLFAFPLVRRRRHGESTPAPREPVAAE